MTGIPAKLAGTAGFDRHAECCNYSGGLALYILSGEYVHYSAADEGAPELLLPKAARLTA